MNTGERIKELRTEKGLSQAELAKAVEIDKSTIAKYETNDREPKMYVLCKLADFFDVSLDFLAGRVDEFGNKYSHYKR